jgi:hypothetical protein
MTALWQRYENRHEV